MHVGVEEPDARSLLRHRDSYIYADSALAYPTLAAEDRYDMSNLGKVQFLCLMDDAGCGRGV